MSKRDTPANQRERHLKRKYGLSETAYNTLLEYQGGVCASCGRAPSHRKRLAVDHDHRCCAGMKTCGKCVRGLLCDLCNWKLGHVENYLDTPQVRIRIDAYRNRHLTVGEGFVGWWEPA